MKPCPIADTNLTLTAPEGMEAEVGAIQARRDEVLGHPCVSTAWEPDPEERAALTAGGPVVLTVMGTTMPPVMLTVQAPEGFQWPHPLNGDLREHCAHMERAVRVLWARLTEVGQHSALSDRVGRDALGKMKSDVTAV